MTDKLLYKLQIETENGANISDIEEKLEDLLMDLYDVGTVEAVLVKDRTPPIDEDIEQLLDVIERIENEDIRRAMDSAKELEDINDE